MMIRDKEITQIAGAQAMHSLVRKDKDLKFNPGLHWQPVQLLEYWGDLATASIMPFHLIKTLA